MGDRAAWIDFWGICARILESVMYVCPSSRTGRKSSISRRWAGPRLAIERHVSIVDGDLSSFFAVAAGGQTPVEAVDQLERMRRYG